MFLKDVLTTNTTIILVLNESHRGGTYLRVTLRKIHVPNNLKKEWDCAWYNVYVAKDYDLSWDADPADYRCIELIFKENPFDFLKNKLGCTVKTEYDYMDSRTMAWDRITFMRFSFQKRLRPAKATPEAKETFLHFLLYNSGLDLTKKNIEFIDRCRTSANPQLNEAACQFHAQPDLFDFYEERIGDALSIENLKMGKLHLTEYEVMTKDFSVTRFSMPPTEGQKNALLAHFNG